MLKSRFYSFVGLLVTVVAFGLPYQARSEGPAAPSSTVTVDTTITGQVRFEARYPRIPISLCNGMPCQSSRMHWSMVIYSGNVRYLVDQKKVKILGDQAPKYIEMQGVRMSAGDTVKVSGEVTQAAPDFYILLNIAAVSLLDEHQ